MTIRRNAHGDLVLTWEQALTMPDIYADVGKFAVAAWLRDYLEQLRAQGFGEGDEVIIGMKPDRELSN